MLRVLLPSLALSLALSGCGGTQPCAEVPEPVQVAEAAPDSAAPPCRPAPAATIPDGHLTMHATVILPSMQGNALILVDPERRWALPVIIGDSEAHVIQLRLAGERFQRPLTHDLLDRVVEELSAEVVMVQVNKLSGGIFVGSIFLWDGQVMHRIDSRTSDAVAVAVGHGVPIYVDRAVVQDAGVSPDELPLGGPPGGPP